MRNEIDFIDGFDIGIELEKLIDPRKKNLDGFSLKVK